MEVERLQVVRDTGGQLNLGHSSRPTEPASTRSFPKFPKLEIPKFEGDKLKWIEFDSIFKATVDNNDCISDAVKFGYLRSLIQGDAKEVIRGFPLTVPPTSS